MAPWPSWVHTGVVPRVNSFRVSPCCLRLGKVKGSMTQFHGNRICQEKGILVRSEEIISRRVNTDGLTAPSSQGCFWQSPCLGTPDLRTEPFSLAEKRIQLLCSE